MSLLFVTSFGPDLYAASGRDLLDSLATVQPAADVLVCYEDHPGKPDGLGQTLRGRRVRLARLDDDPFLQDWLAANREVIPRHLGGDMGECACPGREERHAKHKKGCPGQWMNRNASRWFRKVAAYRLGLARGPRYMVWLDADCLLVRPFPEAKVAQILNGRGVAYCKGHRPAIESGVVLFDLEKGGRVMIEGLADRYVTGRYRADERWDDGYQMTLAAKELKACRPLDLVHPTKYKNKTNDVIPHTPLAEYVQHLKGRHGTGLDLMR